MHAFSFENCTKTKIYDVHLRLQPMLQSRVKYTIFVARQSYQRTFAMVDRASWYARNSCKKCYTVFYFRLVITSV